MRAGTLMSIVAAIAIVPITVRIAWKTATTLPTADGRAGLSVSRLQYATWLMLGDDGRHGRDNLHEVLDWHRRCDHAYLSAAAVAAPGIFWICLRGWSWHRRRLGVLVAAAATALVAVALTPVLAARNADVAADYAHSYSLAERGWRKASGNSESRGWPKDRTARYTSKAEFYGALRRSCASYAAGPWYRRLIPLAKHEPVPERVFPRPR